MAYDISEFDTKGRETIEWLSREYTGIRTGRATPALLDNVKVDSYGTKVPLVQVASVGVEDPRTLRIQPWERDTITNIEKAIVDQDLGVSVAADDVGLRVIFPELTSERREQLLKLAGGKLEEARVSLRSARDDENKRIEDAHKAGDISEDEKFSAKEALQKKVDERNKELDEMLSIKETEISV